jgi:hypothetical protein
MIINQLYLYKHVLSGIGIIFQKRTKSYIFVKLLKRDEVKDKKIEDNLIQKKSNQIMT